MTKKDTIGEKDICFIQIKLNGVMQGGTAIAWELRWLPQRMKSKPFNFFNVINDGLH